METLQARGSTYLTLLTRDGAIAVEFTPQLESHHYAELFEIVKDFDSEAGARQLIVNSAKRWGLKVTF